MMTCVFSRGFLSVSPVNQNLMEAVFRGKVHWSLGPEGWLSQFFFFIINTRWVKFLLAVTDAVYWVELGGRKDAYPRTAAVFFLVAKDSYSFTYYVTFVWFCNAALWDISLYWVEWGICAVSRPSDRHALNNTHLWYYRTIIIYIIYWDAK